DDINFGSLFDQKLRGLGMIVRDRHQERRDSIGIRLLNICAGSDKNFRGFGATIASSVMQRSQPTRREVTRSTFGQSTAHNSDTVTKAGNGIWKYPSGSLARTRFRIDVHTLIDEVFHNVGMIFANSEHQCRLLCCIFERERSLVIDECLHSIQKTAA